MLPLPPFTKIDFLSAIQELPFSPPSSLLYLIGVILSSATTLSSVILSEDGANSRRPSRRTCFPPEYFHCKQSVLATPCVFTRNSKLETRICFSEFLPLPD